MRNIFPKFSINNPNYRILKPILLVLVCLLVIQPVFAGNLILDPAPIMPAAPAQESPQQPLQSNQLLTGPYFVFLPHIRNAATSTSPFLDVSDRQKVVNFYLEHYVNVATPSIHWDGNLQNCDPGTVDQAFQNATLERINFFRAMAGVPNTINFSSASNEKAQAAALMMSVNNALSHKPPQDWICYSALGVQGAGSSNLLIGAYGWVAIYYYMKDPGFGNGAVGHRRWILYPQTQVMGSGDIPPQPDYAATNALVVFDEHLWDARPVTREDYVAWPPPGYVPYQIVFPRWSFSYPKADFSNAMVSMSSGEVNIPLEQSSIENGYGENTLVWIPNGLGDGSSWPNPGSDTRYTVTVSNVVVNAVVQEFTYDVIIINP
jgi:hypothetical protein